MQVPFVDLGAQYAAIGPELEARVLAVLRGGQYVGGPEVASFEQEFVRYCGVREAVAVNSGTAALRVKLPYLDGWAERRRSRAAQYDALLAGAGVETPRVQAGAEHVYHLYVVRHAQRDVLAAALAAEGVATGVHYPLPVHLQPPYREFGGGEGSLPETEAAAREVLSLPMYAELTDGHAEHVAGAVRAAVAELGGAR
ncbi:MAG: hypothetical protein EXR63_01010 [Dehalococcoidia bacterium]|nr:hypothetical protein [Dehalococcoidia bacterium]